MGSRQGHLKRVCETMCPLAPQFATLDPEGIKARIQDQVKLVINKTCQLGSAFRVRPSFWVP